MEHNRAHRSILENYKQLISEYFFLDIKKILTTIAKNCKTCLENKYNRHPSKTNIWQTPIPEYPGQILHVDIFSVEKFHFFTCIDKFSKFTITIPIESRSTNDTKTALLIVLNKFKKTKTIVSGNEKSLQSNTISNMLKYHFNIEQFFIPALHSNSNGQIERAHSTLTEIARCIKAEQNITDTQELILLATYKYNNSIHSTVNAKPLDIINHFTKDHLESVKAALTAAQDSIVKKSNNSQKTYQEGEKVYVRRNKRLGNKLNKVYVENVVQKDLGTTVLINGSKVHKDNLR